MRVHVEGAGFMRKLISPVDLDLPADSTIASLSVALAMQADQGIVFFRKGKRASPNTVLCDGDDILVVSMLSGG